MAGLPPPPTNDATGSFAWLEWFRQLRAYISTVGSVPWSIIDFAGSTLSSIASRSHQVLQSLQGGTTGEYYHLTAAEHAALSAGDHNTLTGLQGGATSEYYHLTSSEHARYKTIEYVVPTTGQSKTVGDTTKYYVMEPAGTLATLTVVMPTTPADGQEVFITSTQVVSALTHSPGAGQTLNGALTTLAANGNAAWVYRSTNTTWYRIS